MSCEAFRPFIDSYVDGEFDERDAAEMEAHLGDCESCRREVQQRLRLKEALQDCMETPGCPDALREEIFEELDRQEAGGEAVDEASDQKRPAMAYAAALVPAAVGIAMILWLFPSLSLTVAPASSGEAPVVEQTVEWHRTDLPVEVSSSKRSHVNRWFRGKVDFPVRLPEFNRERVELLGGRLAHVQDRRAAYVAYEVDGARLSVLIFHGDGVKVPSDRIEDIAGQDVAISNSQGYGVAVMQNHGITYAVTSDLPDDRLLEVIETSLSGESDR